MAPPIAENRSTKSTRDKNNRLWVRLRTKKRSPVETGLLWVTGCLNLSGSSDCP